MGKSIWKLGSAALAVSLLLAGCGGAASSSAAGGPNYADTSGWQGETSSGETGERLMPPQTGRKVIYTSELTLETTDYTADLAAVRALVAAQGGYLASSSENTAGSARQKARSCTLVARIPAENYEAFMQGAGGIGSVSHKSEQSEDVTGQYLDVESRLSSLNTQKQRLEELIAQAATLEDLLTLEDKLAEVQYQLENYAAQRNALSDQIAYSTVTVYLNEVVQYTADEPRFVQQLKEVCGDSWQRFGEVLKGLLFAVILLLPYAVVLGGGAALIWAARRGWRKKHPKALPAPTARPAGAPAKRQTPAPGQKQPYEYGTPPAPPKKDEEQSGG